MVYTTKNGASATSGGYRAVPMYERELRTVLMKHLRPRTEATTATKTQVMTDETVMNVMSVRNTAKPAAK